ncbi:Met18 protein [Saccharomycopsis crataegensis]|uniref:MMS19 nucleotide excision repair protein n=1 Tax=Saccharomycopsis crataegensis TaxID=43959 RepID=A0AAV5QUW0_9ASCO|nr:Met18 protein [Saccharomycopsis crataegensis]
MSDIDGKPFTALVSDYFTHVDDTSDSDEPLNEIVKKITNNDAKLVELIQSLGNDLKNEDGASRAKALGCLSKVLERLPLGKLSSVEIGHLIKFFMTKFDDILAFKQILTGLNSLILMDRFEINEISEVIIKEFTESYNAKNFNAHVRYLTFQILDNIIRQPRNFVAVTSDSKLNDAYIKSFLNIATGEKDPRNLMLSFHLNEIILKQFNNIDSFKEDLFDNSFCYFPIAFKPPKNDPYKITTNDLKSALRNTLTANDSTIEDLLPNLFEKLTSTSMSVKQDVLDTLKDAIGKFNAEVVNVHWIEIWDALKFEILHNDNIPYYSVIRKIDDLRENKLEENLEMLTNDEKEKKESVKVTSSTLLLFKQLATKFAEKDEFLQLYLEKLIEDLLSNINDPKSKLVKQSYLLLSVIAQANDYSFNYIIKNIGPILMKSNKLQAANVEEQKVIIEEISFFLHSYLNLYGSFTNSANTRPLDLETNAMMAHKDEIIIILSRSLVSSSGSFADLKIQALRNLRLLLELKGFLNISEVRMILNYISDILIEYVSLEGNNEEKESQFNKIYKSCLSVLATITEMNNVLISGEFFSQFLSLLADEIVEAPDFKNSEKILSILSDLSCKNSNLLEVLSIRLLSKLNIVIDNCKKNDNKAADYNDKCLKYALLILNVLYNSLFKFLKSHPDFKTSNNFLKKYIPLLLTLCFSIDSKDVFYNDSLVELSSRILFLIVLRSEISMHQEILDTFIGLFVESKATDLFEVIMPENIFNYQSKMVHLFVKSIAGIDFKSTTWSTQISVNDFTDKTIELLNLKEGDVYQRLGYLQLLFMVVNKWSGSSEDDSTMELYSKLTGNIKSHITNNFNETVNDLEIFVWIAKALILKNHRLSADAAQFLLGLIDDAAKSPEAKALSDKICKSFDILVTEEIIFKVDYTRQVDSGMKRKLLKKDGVNHNINLKPLYKQKLFEILIPSLISSFQTNTKVYSDGDDENSTILKKAFYLTTLSLVSNHMSTDIILMQLEDLFPLLIESIKLNSSQVRGAALTTLDSLITERTVKLIGNYLSSLIPTLINCFKSANYFKKDLDENAESLKIDKVFMKYNSPEVREKSLGCLLKLCQYIDLIKLVPFKEVVLKNMVVPLDDKKRDVRKKACDCRQDFYELGQVKA